MDDSSHEWIDSSKRSPVWNFFQLYRPDGKKVRCKICHKQYTYLGSTTIMRGHCNKVHSIDFNDSDKVDFSKESSFFNLLPVAPPEVGKDPLEKVLSRMVAKALIPLQTLATSEDLLNGLIAQGYAVPRSSEDIRGAIESYADRIRANIKTSVSNAKAEGRKVSLSFDEFASIGSRHYICLNVHVQPGKMAPLGMIRVHDNDTGEIGKQMIQDKLAQFDLCLSDVFGAVTERASAMMKTVRLLNCVHQDCTNQAIQLAISDALCLSKVTAVSGDEICVSDFLCLKREIVDGVEVDMENDPLEEDVNIAGELNDDDEDAHNDFGDHAQNRRRPLKEDIDRAVEKAERIVRNFRTSPLKDEALQKLYGNQKGIDLNRLKEMPTRWNNLLYTLERFLAIKDYVHNTLLNIGQLELFPNEEEIAILTHLVNSLELFDAVAKKLSRANSTLADAEKIFEFLLSNLRMQAEQSKIPLDLHQAAKIRISQRRNMVLSGLCSFLENNDYFDDLGSSELEKPSKKAVSELASSIYASMIGTTGESTDDGRSNQSEIELEGPAKKSKFDELSDLLAAPSMKKRPSIGKFSTNEEILHVISADMRDWERTGTLPATLKGISRIVQSLPPTSTEAGRSFSAEGLFGTRKGSRLSDKTVDSLCLLRGHFLKEK